LVQPLSYPTVPCGGEVIIQLVIAGAIAGLAEIKKQHPGVGQLVPQAA